MIRTLLWIVFYIYGSGFILILLGHLFLLQMVTFELALLRALVWPIWLAFGWPHGIHLPMD